MLRRRASSAKLLTNLVTTSELVADLLMRAGLKLPVSGRGPLRHRVFHCKSNCFRHACYDHLAPGVSWAFKIDLTPLIPRMPFDCKNFYADGELEIFLSES